MLAYGLDSEDALILRVRKTAAASFAVVFRVALGSMASVNIFLPTRSTPFVVVFAYPEAKDLQRSV